MFPFHQLQGAIISGKIQPSKTNNEKENQEEKVIDAGLIQNRMTEEEVEGTQSPEHLPKPTRTRYTQSRSDPPRETGKSETDTSRQSPYKKGLTSSSNFELIIDNGHINLFHRGKKVIDLSNPENQVFHNSVTFKLEHNSLKIINSSGYTQRSYDGVKILIAFDGRHISEHRGAMVQVFVSKGQLFVSKDKAFYSSSEQLNMLLNDQLARVIPHLPDTMLMFQTLPGGDLMLVIDGEPVINLSGAEVKELPISSFIRYLNGTIYVHNMVEQRVKVYSGVDQFNVLDGIRPGLEKHNKILSGLQIFGGGRLYVHTNTGAAFYSRNRQINTAIGEHITRRFSEPPRNLVFTIKFENSSDNQNDENLEIVLLMNGDEIFHFNPKDTEDQSLTLRHFLKYTNETLFILEDNYDVAGGFIDIKELLVFNGITTSIIYKGSAHGVLFAGGGQVFNSGARAFYSLNTNLNDQIGEAILAAG